MTPGPEENQESPKCKSITLPRHLYECCITDQELYVKFDFHTGFGVVEIGYFSTAPGTKVGECQSTVTSVAHVPLVSTFKFSIYSSEGVYG